MPEFKIIESYILPAMNFHIFTTNTYLKLFYISNIPKQKINIKVKDLCLIRFQIIQFSHVDIPIYLQNCIVTQNNCLLHTFIRQRTIKKASRFKCCANHN